MRGLSTFLLFFFKTIKVIFELLSAINDYSAAHGRVAYRLGLRDGIRLMSEIRKFE